MRTEISFVLGKNGGYIPSSLGDRLISVGRQAGMQVGRQAGRQLNEKFMIRQLQFSEILSLVKLFE